MSVSKVVQLCSGLRLMGRSCRNTRGSIGWDCVRISPKLVRGLSRSPMSTSAIDRLADVAALGKYTQRCTREHPPADIATPAAYNLVFTRLRLFLNDSRGLTVVERLDSKRGATKKQTKGSGAGAAAPAGEGGGTKTTRKRTGDGGGDGSGYLRGVSIPLARGTTNDADLVCHGFRHRA